MEFNEKLGRYVWTKEDWLFALPAIVGGLGGFGFIIFMRWLFTGLLFPFN